MYFISYTKKAAADIPKLKSAKLDKKARALIDLIREAPFKNPPPYEKLVGDLQGAYSRRINIKHRLVYEVLPNSENLKDDNGTPYEGIVKMISLWTHYER